jgi:hypothetical protein
MKKLLIVLLLGSAFTSCMKKVDKIEVSNNFSSAAFINASPSATFGATSGVVFIDNFLQSTGGIAYRGVSSPLYLAVAPGTHNVQFRAATIDSTVLVNRPSENFNAGAAYTYVVYDTVMTNIGPRSLRSVRLTDDLSLPGAKSDSLGKVRFLHLAPNQGPVDVTFLRTNQGHLDSVTISGRSYIGNNPTPDQVAQLSQFSTTLPFAFAGTYSIKVKTAGTQTVIASGLFALTTSAFGQGIATVYLAGSAQGQGLTVNVVRHFP